MLDREYLLENMSYDKETGICQWIKNKKNRYMNKPIGSMSSNGYLLLTVNGKTYTLHRVIWVYMGGGETKEIDHINCIRDDNRWVNLRPCTSSQNRASAKRKNTPASGYRGVVFETGKWLALITVNKEKIRIGRFICKIDAARAYDKMAKEKFGEFATLNFLPS